MALQPKVEDEDGFEDFNGGRTGEKRKAREGAKQALEQDPQNKQEQQQRQWWPTSSSEEPPRNWNKALNATDWAAFTEARTLIPTLVLTGSILAAVRIRRRLRRFPDATSISSSFFRQRSIFGEVTSVGDGDNFRLYHTPGGRLTGWGWLPWKKVPTSRKDLKDKTVCWTYDHPFSLRL